MNNNIDIKIIYYYGKSKICSAHKELQKISVFRRYKKVEDKPLIPETRQAGRRLKFSVLIAVVLLVLAGAAGICWLFRKDVTILDGNTVREVKTFKSDIKGVLHDAGIILGPKDEVVPSLNQSLKKGMEIKIIRAFPVKIRVDGGELSVMTTKNTVGDVLCEAGIEIGTEDRVEPSLDGATYPYMEIKVTRITYDYVTENQRIYYHLIKKKNDSLEKGITRVIQPGREGVKEVIYRVTYEDGVEVSREVISENIIKEHQDKIVEYGTIDTFTTSRGERVRFTKAYNMIATAYDAGYQSTGKTPDHPEYGITYTGMKVRRGVVAVDPKVIPLGTRLYVEGYGFAIAADTGSAIKGYRIDLYHDTYEEAMRYGRRKVKVYILADQD